MRAYEGISCISVLVPTWPWACRQGLVKLFAIPVFICILVLIWPIFCYNVINTPARVFDIDGTGF